MRANARALGAGQSEEAIATATLAEAVRLHSVHPCTLALQGTQNGCTHRLSCRCVELTIGLPQFRFKHIGGQ
jgi:hypothetical protein